MMRQQIDIHHEQMMEAERMKEEISFAIGASEEGSELEAALVAVLEDIIRYGLVAMEEADLIAAQN